MIYDTVICDNECGHRYDIEDIGNVCSSLRCQWDWEYLSLDQNSSWFMLGCMETEMGISAVGQDQHLIDRLNPVKNRDGHRC